MCACAFVRSESALVLAASLSLLSSSVNLYILIISAVMKAN